MPERAFLWRIPAVVLLVLSISGCSTVQGWFSSDDEDPNEPFELTDFEAAVKIKKRWSTSLGGGQGDGYFRLRPVLDGERLFAVGADGDVLALERESGKKIWKVDLETTISGGLGLYENSLFLGTNNGAVQRLDADSGAVLWSRKLSSEVLSAPAADGRVVVAQTFDGKLHGLDYGSGEILWVYDSNVPVLTIRGTSSPLVAGGLVFAAFANGRVSAFDIRSGALAWEARVAIAQGRSEIERIVDIDGTMELVGNMLYAVSYQGNLAAIDVSAGRKIWQEEASSWAGVGQGFGNIYIAEENGTVSAYQRGGQGLRWQQPALGFRKLSRPTPVSSYVAVGDFEGYVHLLSQVDGAVVGRIRADSKGVRGDMIGDGNRLYVFGDGGKLLALDINPIEGK